MDAEDLRVDFTSETTDINISIKWSALKGLFS
jgi:hypothetical protein